MENFITRECCPACGHAELDTLRNNSFNEGIIFDFLDTCYEGKIPKVKMDSTFLIRKCKNCTHIFQANILTEENMYLLYEQWISQNHSLQKREQANIDAFAINAFEVQMISRMLGSKPNETNVLEFGMGWGALVTNG